MGELVFDSFAGWLLRLLANAAQQVLEQMMTAFESSTQVSFTNGWWVQPQSQAIVESVALLAAALMSGCLLLAALQGMLAGEPITTLRAALVEAPISVLGIILLTGAATTLLKLTDAASAMVYGGDTAGPILLTLIARAGGSGALHALLLALFTLGAFLVWVELVVRSALIYLLAAFAPLLLAARVWPAARPAWHKLLEVGLALIFSKFAIALALALGAAALQGRPPDESDLSGLLAGAALLLVAAFTPFALLRLMPAVEAAVGAQGIGRSPGRGLLTAMQTGYYTAGLARLAGGGLPPALTAPTPPPAPPPPGDTRDVPSPVPPAVGPGRSHPRLPPGNQPPALGPGPRALGPGPSAGGPGDPNPGATGPAATGEPGTTPPSSAGSPAAPHGAPEPAGGSAAPDATLPPKASGGSGLLPAGPVGIGQLAAPASAVGHSAVASARAVPASPQRVAPVGVPDHRVVLSVPPAPPQKQP